jgi:tRNA threonylcarbamoyl adenosine modification protein YeaZ
MKILALEFSPPERSVAVIVDGMVRGFVADDEPQGHRAFALISQALQQAGLEPASIECIAVGVGPGSYAGTRMAIGIAQGWQLGRDVKIMGVQSADALAREAQRSGVFGTVNFVFDAQRNEAYAIRYHIGPTEIRVLDGFQVLDHQEEARRRADGEALVKADAGPWGGPGDRRLLSYARAIGELASARADFIPGYQIEPVYLRKADFVKAPLPKFMFPEA